MKKLRLFGTVCAMKLLKGLGIAALYAFSLTAHGYTEVGDAGQVIEDNPPPQTLPGGTTNIYGSFYASFDIDMYRFGWAGSSGFTATVLSTDEDTELYLFGSDLKGLWANNDLADGTSYTSEIVLSENQLPAGTYYLAIALWDTDPVDIDYYSLCPHIRS